MTAQLVEDVDALVAVVEHREARRVAVLERCERVGRAAAALEVARGRYAASWADLEAELARGGSDAAAVVELARAHLVAEADVEYAAAVLASQ